MVVFPDGEFHTSPAKGGAVWRGEAYRRDRCLKGNFMRGEWRLSANVLFAVFTQLCGKLCLWLGWCESHRWREFADWKLQTLPLFVILAKKVFSMGL